MTVKKIKIGRFFLFPIISLGLVIIFFVSYQASLKNRIYYGVKIGGVDVGGLDKNSAYLKLFNELAQNSDGLSLAYNNSVFYLPQDLLKVNYDLKTTTGQAYSVGRVGNWWARLVGQYFALAGSYNFGLVYSADNQYLNFKIDQIAVTIDKAPVRPEIKQDNEQILVSKGETGRKLNQAYLKRLIGNSLASVNDRKITIPVDSIGTILSDSEQAQVKETAKFLARKELALKFGDQSWKIDNDQVFKLVTIGSFDNFILKLAADDNSSVFELKSLWFGQDSLVQASSSPVQLTTNQEKVAELVAKIANEVDRPAKNALFQFDQEKVTVFQPAVDGQKVDQPKLTTAIAESLLNSSQDKLEINLPVTITTATIKTSQVNNLGINELVGQGKSSFAGSSTERIHNIKLATSRINGILVAPGDTFSFNNTVGEISLSSGYTNAYIISKGKTILGEGGGVCQVSTTIFRAAVFAGLPIEERHAHAYRVSYYEQAGSRPGLDATIYSPNIDLKFKNDTPAYILIQAYVQGTNLYFDIYGTSDGRVVNVSNPIITNAVPAPGPAYEEDPTLPKGTTKQVDFAASGANVKVTRTVTKSGQQILTDTFVSNYKPWQAVFKVGTKEG